uniref:Uncharacterized protein n=1 Tax=Anguilla anguilla TaxID=7936 RepID=A0A0E9QCT1_ANGAN
MLFCKKYGTKRWSHFAPTGFLIIRLRV